MTATVANPSSVLKSASKEDLAKMKAMMAAEDKKTAATKASINSAVASAKIKSISMTAPQKAAAFLAATAALKAKGIKLSPENL